jgi:hypothetical protein
MVRMVTLSARQWAHGWDVGAAAGLAGDLR